MIKWVQKYRKQKEKGTKEKCNEKQKDKNSENP